jgi:hypothetical protein
LLKCITITAAAAQKIRIIVMAGIEGTKRRGSGAMWVMESKL